MSPHEEHKISSEYKIQSELTCYWFSVLLSAKDYAYDNLTLNLILLFNFALTPIHDRYMPA